MARQKKCYPSIDQKTNRHQPRGGGFTTRLNRAHRYPTRDLKDTQPNPSPTWLAARAAKKLKA